MNRKEKNKNIEIEIHPYPPFLPTNATHLILGTFPTHAKNRRFNFFYAGRNNFFWRILSEIYDYTFSHSHDAEAVEERRQFLTRNKIALYNMIYSCRRKVAHSSKDTDLEVLEKSDILSLIKQLPKLKTIVLAGSSGAISPRQLFLEHLSENDIVYRADEATTLPSGSFIFGKRTINFITVYATSGTNIGRYAIAVEQYRKALQR